MFWKLDLLLSSGEVKEGEGGVTKPTRLGHNLVVFVAFHGILDDGQSAKTQ
jgi:hypothetical protein